MGEVGSITSLSVIGSVSICAFECFWSNIKKLGINFVIRGLITGEFDKEDFIRVCLWALCATYLQHLQRTKRLYFLFSQEICYSLSSCECDTLFLTPS